MINTITLLIRIYQLFVSPYLGRNCRFEPTCSHYAKEALCIHGVRKGIYISLRRLLRCHPWGGMGYDPVPDKTTTELPKTTGPMV